MKKITLSLYILFVSVSLAFAGEHENTNRFLQQLCEGNQRFYKGQATHQHQDSIRLHALTDGQSPFAVVVSCSDSRIPPEIIFDQGLGDIFTVRTAGHVVGDLEMGSIEYAAEHLGAKLIIVMGHDNCGAIKTFIEHAHDNDVPGHIAQIVDAIKAEPEQHDLLQCPGDPLERCTISHIRYVMQQLQTSDPILAALFADGEITIVGAIYHIATGTVDFLP